MFLKRNLVENVTILSCSGSVIGIFLNYVTNISPVTGFWFITYVLFLFIVSVLFTFNCIQWVLQLNKPLKYDLDNFVSKYSYLSFLLNKLPKLPKASTEHQIKEYDTNELSIISTVLEKRLVSSWYVPYISQEIGFPFACKQMLDLMISKTFKIAHKIELKDIYVDVCAIFISHLKEYKKAIKRHEKLPNNAIDTLYKKIHCVSDSKNKKHGSADHCTNVLRLILKELVPWELWDTPHSELLVRILSKKLDDFIDSTLSDPVWLNDKLLLHFNEHNKEPNATPEMNKDTKDEFIDKLCEKPSAEPDVDIKHSEVNSIPMKEVVEESKKDQKHEVEIIQTPVMATEEIKPAAILRQRRGRQGRNEVKIYDRIIEGSVKTWETDMDLQCISVGQDLLAGLDDIPLSRLWGLEDTEHSPNIRSASPQPLWFGEEDAIELESYQKEVKKESSPKSTDALLKDLQTTVHHAKTKIGDLQVPKNVDVPCKHSGDEAAGMMEGLFDKGMAGLKKGLRFTGLSDDTLEKSPSHQRQKGQEKISPSDLTQAKSKPVAVPEAREMNVSTREDNGNSIHLLVKQNRVTSQDNVSPQAKLRLDYSPPPIIPLSDSPELEYEETADLSSSIAKLRSLLQEAGPREDVWWESAEETRGRTQQHPSSRPVDTATLADEYDMNMERNASPGQATNNMQRLDKLFQRTVTGVFNSIKTAVGGEGGEFGEEAVGVAGGLPAHMEWSYVCSAAELSIGGAVGRLVGSRKAMSHVDAALDSLQQLPPPPAQPPMVPEDLEEWCMSEGARWSGTCELAAAAGLLHSHLAYRVATLLCADVVEHLISIWLEELGPWLREQVFVYFQQLANTPPEPSHNRELRPFDIDETCQVLKSKIPASYLFSDDTLINAIKLIVTSFSHKDVNKDVMFRLLDMFAAHFKKSSAFSNPSFDNN